MVYILAALAIIGLGFWALGRFKRANVVALAKRLRMGAGIAAGVLAIAATLRGLIGYAMPLATLSIWLLSGGKGLPWSQSGQPAGGKASRIVTDHLEMELDHDTGAMRGTILAGARVGQSLDALDVATLMAFLPDIDEESRALLMAYLDRREPGWREHAQAGATAGPGSWSTGKMTEEEAYQILGLAPGASVDDISRAHRTLMKKLHPDQGGSTYLAARVNEAKDVLTRRHR